MIKICIILRTLQKLDLSTAGLEMAEYVLGGLAACGAGFFSNPIEVVKTRLQLQGELRARGHYQRHYRNPIQAFYAIAKQDGILSLQKGAYFNIQFTVHRK